MSSSRMITILNYVCKCSFNEIVFYFFMFSEVQLDMPLFKLNRVKLSGKFKRPTKECYR